MNQERHPNRSKLDFLYHEVLGEVADLTQRIEGINARQAQTVSDLVKLATGLEVASQTLTNLPTELGLQVQQSLQAGSQFLQDELQQRMQKTLAPTQTRLQSLANDSAQYARLTHHSAKRITVLAIIAGAIAGALGGVLVGVALARYFT
jgi:hypothetical protein